MPELPEVETIVRELKKEVLNRTFLDVWTDNERMIKKLSLASFRKQIKGKKINKVQRRAKNILFYLSGGKVLLVHLKMTGHFLLGKWRKEESHWVPLTKGEIAKDPMNRFLHLIFWLDNGKMLALSDLRKFAKAEIWDKKELEERLTAFGPEPLEKGFTYDKFKEALKNKKGRIKQTLMDQAVIAGIGNIYSDEILFDAKVHPSKIISNLSEKEKRVIYSAIKKILSLGVKLRGESFSDYRRTLGQKGFYDKARKVYRRTGEKCPSCGGIIERIKIGGRSAHFCPKCQRI
ncbi:MAG: DNA-formamidopyrimidine glycosylase [Candidatus Paceibacterota bacterium]|jgi:formamidopyrimidine-DNA glycosylase